MIRTEAQPGELLAQLRRMARELGDTAPLLEAILEGLENLGAEYVERAQRIPLAESTLRRRQYPRESVGRFNAKAERRESARARLSAAGTASARRKRNGFSVERTRSALAVPSRNGRVLERVGGFLESFTAEASRFDVRSINREASSLRFGSKLGGLWKLHGTGYQIGRRKVTQVPARFPFGFSDESQREIGDVIEKAQKDFVEGALP